MKDQLDTLVSQLIDHGIVFEDAVNEFEKRFIRRVLEKNNGNLSKAAKELCIHRNTLSRKITELSVDHEPKRHKRSPR